MSGFSSEVLYSLLAFVFLGMIFIPLERIAPFRAGQKILRSHLATDIFFFFGQYLIWSALIYYILSQISFLCGALVPTTWRDVIASQPGWLRTIEVIVLGDFIVYWFHRLQHSNQFLWRFHAVHHTSEQLDWVAAHREHPIDGLLTQTVINIPVFLIGFDPDVLTYAIIFRGVWAIYIHSNCRIPIGFLKLIFGSPDLHRWHHANEKRSRNYANLSPLMDILFGTFENPPFEPAKLGVPGHTPKGYFQLLIHPLLISKSKK